VKKILLLDNYDSFTYNVLHLLEQVTEGEIIVALNDKISLREINNFSHIVLSPGPGLPKDAGIMPELLQQYCSSKKILGVCLGMQAIAENFGGKLKNLDKVYHGIATKIKVTDKEGIFNDCPDEFLVARYHSWVVDLADIPKTLVPLALDEENNLMALKHSDLNICGVQFHPESILSEHGKLIMNNWANG
jgi:anthranilate synthase component II